MRAKLDAHTSTLGALRETQLEQDQRLTALENTVEQGFSTVHAGIARITALLSNLTGERDGHES